MSRHDFLPTKESELVTWTTSFTNLIVGSPTDYGLTVPEATAYQALSDDFIAAYLVVQNNLTRSPANIILKNEKKALMIEGARALSRQIQGTPSVTPAMKSELGLNPRITPRVPIPVPSEMPEVDVNSVVGRVVTVRLHSATSEGRAKPNGVGGAMVYTFVGETPPDELGEWFFQGNVTRTLFEIEFPNSVAPGTKVWVTAAWTNPRGQAGPACDPVSTHVQFGGVSASMEAALKVAA